MEALKKSKHFAGPEGPVVLAILDGVGIGRYDEGDMTNCHVRYQLSEITNQLSDDAISHPYSLQRVF
jgi:hypothetical protein